ncbi:cobalamin biosynthesis protein [Actinoplanes aureus]|uniref:cobalamin biosynthesis protein n=1 Tax=Actinoplanes aureus TaxID=2792083 RepID=UPI002814E581|nr:cobalamin biosynthesis protein [Actinoplanes aureus]
MGARAGTAGERLAGAIRAVLAGAGIAVGEVAVLATLDRRAAEDGVRAVAAEAGWRLVGYPAAVLAGQPVPGANPVVAAAVGTPSVAEAAALLAAGPGAVLVVPKRVCDGVTVAVARG